MSADAAPISHIRFAAALTDLPISALHAKITELQNSIAHLQKSNAELEDYVRETSDKDCYEALVENKDVIKRMEERIELVKKEITEVRGLPLVPPGENGVDGAMEAEERLASGTAEGPDLVERIMERAGGEDADGGRGAAAGEREPQGQAQRGSRPTGGFEEQTQAPRTRGPTGGFEEQDQAEEGVYL